MNITIDLDGELREWASKQPNVSEAIKQILKTHIEHTQTPFEIALTKFRENLLSVPEDWEFEVPQIVGREFWENLDWGSRLSFGRHIRANQEAYGVVYVRQTQSRHAVYKRAVNLHELSEPIQGNVPRRLIEPHLTTTFNQVYTAISEQPNRETPLLQTTRGVPFRARAAITRKGQQFISLPHNNRIYEGDWGYKTNSMGQGSGQRIGHYSVPLNDWVIAVFAPPV